MPFYAVKVGRSSGIFKSWAECEKQVSGFAGAVFKKFATMCEAEDFISNGTDNFRPKRPLLPNGQDTESIFSSEPPTKMTKDIRPVDSSAVDNLLPVPFMHDLNEASKVLVYTDGSCKGPLENRRAGFGVFWGTDHPWNVSERLKGRQTNNRAEIEACIRALKQANDAGIRGVKIVTDSKFTIKCATVWYFRWQKNDWKLANGTPVLHRKDIQRLVEQLAVPGLHVSWCHSPGHQGKWGNEQADRLANIGADLPYPCDNEEDPGDVEGGEEDFDEEDI
uniref:Ribonuclease H1 n=2 Tax=Mesocestoides corti TaxID=53468 RepID=A0A5K3EL77_MESCO